MNKFNEDEVSLLLQLNGAGSTVIKRFEQIGISSFEELKHYDVNDIADKIASMLHTTCWKNSPKAKSAINATIELAKANT